MLLLLRLGLLPPVLLILYGLGFLLFLGYKLLVISLLGVALLPPPSELLFSEALGSPLCVMAPSLMRFGSFGYITFLAPWPILR
jgi:hypothetical protein